jgi:hypothetical protein
MYGVLNIHCTCKPLLCSTLSSRQGLFCGISMTGTLARLSKHSMEIASYRSTLGGLISRLHGEYFPDEPAPFSGIPSTVNIQTRQQSRSIRVQMLFDVRDKISEKLSEFDEVTKERTFLQKVKGSIWISIDRMPGKG